MSDIFKAIRFAQEKHEGQLDDSGEDYFSAHVERVALAIGEIIKDEGVICAAYLHDTIEDTDTTYEELVDKFGKRVADLVMEVTHEGKKDEYGFYFPRLESKEGIMIKLVDRASNISRMDAWSESRRKQYLRRTKFWKDGSDRKVYKP